MKLTFAAGAILIASAMPSFAQGTDQTSSNSSVPAQVRSGAQSTAPATDPIRVAPGTPASPLPEVAAPRAGVPDAAGVR